MKIDPEATGKILGMVMAYAVSALGLLLAYINYRKRVVKAERIFTRRAKAVITVITATAAAAAIGFAVAAGGTLLTGVVVPLLIFLVSFVITWLLYRRFARTPGP